MAELKLSFLGTPRIERVSPLDVSTRKGLALLAYVAVTAQSHSRDALAAMFWPDADTASAKGTLRYTLSMLRKQIGAEWFEIDRQNVALNWDANPVVDVVTFRHLRAQAMIPNVSRDQAKSALTQAMTFYQGEFLAGFTLEDSPSFDEWQFFETESLRNEVSQVLDLLVQYYAEDEEWETAVSYARRWVGIAPLHEPAHYHLMQLYAQTGQRAAALRQYDVCAQLLTHELGVQPSAPIVELYKRLQSSAGAMPAVAASPSLQPQTPHYRFPRPVTPFVGRQQELLAVHDLLGDPGKRLVTISGPGGIGKTRLALQTAVDPSLQFRDGIYYVDLVPVSSPQLLAVTVADALALPLKKQVDPCQQVLAYLADKDALLLLDNFEHLLDDVSFVEDLLSNTEHVKLLVTSREALNLPQEWLYALPGLSASLSMQEGEGSTTEAAQLFVQQARRVRHDFSLAAEETAVMRICQVVGGSPLAIELAAAWVKLLSCAEIVHAIRASLDFLTTTSRGIPPRHASMRAVFVQTWQYLTPDEQQVLVKLALFPGGFTIEAARQVTQTTLSVLYSLANKSLLQQTTPGRHHLHSLLRQFASEKQDAFTEVLLDAQKHYAAYYAQFLQQQETQLLGVKQKEGLDLISTEIDNVRQAWQWAVHYQLADVIQQALPGLYAFYGTRGWFAEGIEAFHRAETALPADRTECQLVQAHLLTRQGEFYYELGQLAQAEAKLEASLQLYRQLSAATLPFSACNLLGVVYHLQGKYAAAHQWASAALHIATDNDNLHQIALARLSLGSIAQSQGAVKDSQEHFGRSLRIYRQLEYGWGIAHALRFLGTAALQQGDWVQAQQHHQESLKICRTINDQTGVALALNNLGLVAEAERKYEAAREYYEQALMVSEEDSIQIATVISLKNLGGLLYRNGHYETAYTRLRRAWQLATTAQATPLALDVVTEIAQGFLESGQEETAQQLLDVVWEHPAVNWATQQRAETLRHRLKPPSSWPQLLPGIDHIETAVTDILTAALE